MSIEALRWAMRQTSRNSATQCVLLVLANAADPEGLALSWWKGRDHWWPYLMEKTRLSRGALFRILRELEELGYFTRTETKPTEGGVPTMLIPRQRLSKLDVQAISRGSSPPRRLRPSPPVRLANGRQSIERDSTSHRRRLQEMYL